MVKNPPANAGVVRDASSILGSGRSPEMQVVVLPGESHGQRRLVDFIGSHRVRHDGSDLA